MPDDASKVTPEDFNRAANMDELLKLLDGIGMNNGWAKKTPSLWPLPNKDFVPAHWRYKQAKAALDAAGRFVNTELAERRNLIMFNPIEGNDYATVKTLISAYGQRPAACAGDRGQCIHHCRRAQDSHGARRRSAHAQLGLARPFQRGDVQRLLDGLS